MTEQHVPFYLSGFIKIDKKLKPDTMLCCHFIMIKFSAVHAEHLCSIVWDWVMFLFGHDFRIGSRIYVRIQRRLWSATAM